MKLRLSSRSLVMVAGLFLASQALTAQDTIQLFSAVNVRNSTTTHYSNLVTFGSSTVSMTCPTDSPIAATLSGPEMKSDNTAPLTDGSGNLQPGGKLLVDNAFLFTVTPQGGAAGSPINACAINQDGNFATRYNGEDIPAYLQYSCFTSGYGNYAQTLASANANPDTAIVPNGTITVDAAGGVRTVDISSSLVSGQQSVNFELVDGGGQLASSSIFLQTNCMINGVSSGTAGGNPITDDSGKNQTFTFNTLPGKNVDFTYDVSGVTSFSGAPDGSIPETTDSPIDPTVFQPEWVADTPFATSRCFVHNGEVLDDGLTQACKLYSLQCLSSDGTTIAGANCPKSGATDEKVIDHFDGPALQTSDLPNIYNSNNQLVAHTGVGFLMASEDWMPNLPNPAGQCAFEAASGLSALPCPRNLMRNFSGPGVFSSTGLTRNPNSTFISIYGVPQPLTTVKLQGAKSGNWVNTSQPQIGFVSTPPNFTNGAFINGNTVPLPGAATFIPAPIQSITYGISAAPVIPSPLDEPTLNDTTLMNTVCPTTFYSSTEPSFTPSKQTLNNLADGQYIFHYYAEDCSGTQELQFTTDHEINNEPVWATSFYTLPIKVDTVPPAITINSPSPEGSYIRKNATVYVNFTCSDAGGGEGPGGLNNGSGVTHCGSNSYNTETTYNTGPLLLKLNTSGTGAKSYTIVAVDGAGNSSSVTINYTVTK